MLPGALPRIGEDVTERLDIVPAQFRVLVVRRSKYGCRAYENGVEKSRVRKCGRDDR